MKFSFEWLNSMVHTGWDLETTCSKLNDLGLEVEETTPVAGVFSGVVVGKVLTVTPHPNADKLRVTTVDVGQDAPVRIVCGAPNVEVGMMVPTALGGAVLPNITIKDAKLRGVDSFGMLCSAGELGIEGQASGLWPLPDTLPIGADLRVVLGLDDTSIEVSLTPNRADALSVVGIARDLGALSGASLTRPTAVLPESSIAQTPTIHVHDTIACPTYLGCIVEMPAGVETPLWMQERLRRSGLRSLGLWVDVTNYVLLEWGQPMHAFDLDKLQGAIHVRSALAGETCILLDGKQVSLSADTLVIADDRGAIALAGIMGGAETAVDAQTTRVMLECAHFTPDAIVGRARKLGLHTDSSHRFERGVDPLCPLTAMTKALSLLVTIGQAKIGEITQVQAESQTKTQSPMVLRQHSIQRLLGITLPDDQVMNILSGLGMQVVTTPEGWQVTPPSWRFDMSIEADLVEELARMIGLDNLPKLPLPATSKLPSGRSQQEMKLKHLLVSKGYQEAITYSFVDGKEQALIEPEHQGINLANPIAETLGQMRLSLWTGLLSAVRYNLNRQAKRVRLFETGLRFLPQTDHNGLPVQIATLAGVACGTAYSMQWGQNSRQVDFYDVKGDVEAILATAGLSPTDIIFAPSTHPALHPGQSATILYYNQPIGLMGVIHPSLAKQCDVDASTVLFSLDLAHLTALPTSSQFLGLSKFPAVRRDIAVVLDASVPFSAVQSAIRTVSRTWFQGAELFDVYAGKGLAEGQRSLAIALWFQDLERTLTDHEIDDFMTEVIATLTAQTGAQLRT